tara:strand:+ start:139 stop:345 length:207 start_codon:yes stop_codon:yes gene_type:complete
LKPLINNPYFGSSINAGCNFNEEWNDSVKKRYGSHLGVTVSIKDHESKVVDTHEMEKNLEYIQLFEHD